MRVDYSKEHLHNTTLISLIRFSISVVLCRLFLIIVNSHLIRLRIRDCIMQVVPYNSQLSFNPSAYRRCIMHVAPYNRQILKRI